MIIQYCSDLHLEFDRNKDLMTSVRLQPVAETLILAGDIVPFAQIEKHDDFFSYISDHFKETYWIPGNHEYYHYNLANRCGAFHVKIRDNVSLLNDQVVNIIHYQFIFSTLWSNVSPENAPEIERRMNDYHLIHVDGQRFSTQNSNKLHNDSIRFIRNTLLDDAEALKKIVVTHHLPTYQNYPSVYLGDALNQAFATDLDILIMDTQPDYWIFGHNHRNVDEFTIGKTRMLTNQLGYVQYDEHTKFKTNCTIDI